VKKVDRVNNFSPRVTRST